MPYAKESDIRGAGDLVAKVTEITGIDKAVKKAAKKLGKDCGCDVRRELLNKLIPFKK
jgi:glycerol dehydrogenase-like iron-containing ADH family enzyme